MMMAMLASVALAGPVVINEIRTEEFGSSGTSDTDYFELAGTPGESLSGLTYVVLGGSNDGQIQSVTSLAGLSIQADGFFLAARPGFLLGTPDAELNFTFTTFNKTHLLVSGFTGAFGDDLDTDDDGTLDTLPWGSIVDAVGIVNQTDSSVFGFSHYYGATLGFPDVGPDANDSAGPLHIYRDPDVTGLWKIGPAAPAGLLGEDTPGFPNITDGGNGNGGGNGGGGNPIPLPPAAWAAVPMIVGIAASQKWTRRRGSR